MSDLIKLRRKLTSQQQAGSNRGDLQTTREQIRSAERDSFVAGIDAQGQEIAEIEAQLVIAQQRLARLEQQLSDHNAP